MCLLSMRKILAEGLQEDGQVQVKEMEAGHEAGQTHCKKTNGARGAAVYVQPKTNGSFSLRSDLLLTSSSKCWSVPAYCRCGGYPTNSMCMLGRCTTRMKRVWFSREGVTQTLSAWLWDRQSLSVWHTHFPVTTLRTGMHAYCPAMERTEHTVSNS